MVTGTRVACSAAVLLALCGCTDLTEFEYTMRAGINIMYTPDLSVVHTIDDISGARSLCPLPGCFIVATTEGMLFRFDLESYEQTGSYTIGSPSSAGYFEIEYSPTENSVYIIGTTGQIIELHVPDMEVMDIFSVCDAPVDIEIGTQLELPYLYVADATSSTIFEVRLLTNSKSRSCILPSSPTCMAIAQSQDSILVGTLGETELVSIITASMKHRTMNHLPGMLAIEPIPEDTTLSAVFDWYIPKIAIILRFFPDYFYPDKPLYTGTASVAGDIHYMCASSDGFYVYVLSYLGDNISSLIAYDCRDYTIESQIDLTGYPLDLKVSPGGTLLVLTSD